MPMETPSPAKENRAAREANRAAREAALRRALLLLSVTLMVLGGVGAPLFTRIYFLHGGTRLWLMSLLQTVGFPIVLPCLAASHSLRHGRHVRVFSVSGPAAAACAAIGVLVGLDSFMFAYGSSSLPVSTIMLLNATQLAFVAGFAFLIVKQRFTAYSINAVVLLVMGPVILGLQSSGDRPAGESRGRFFLGFFMALGAAVLVGLIMPLVQLTSLRMKRKMTYALVMEMQLVMAISGTAFSAVAMLINKDFQAIRSEAKEFRVGERKYYLVLATCAIFWQFVNFGFVGVVSCSSSLLAGVVNAVLVPLGEILPVLVLHEKFNSGKGVAMALCLWGFASYLYGEHLHHKERKEEAHKVLELEFSGSPDVCEAELGEVPV